MMHLHPVYDTDPHFSIDVETRAITYMSYDRLIIVQGDHNSERYTFEMPRFVDGHDMMLCNLVQVHYINIDSNDQELRSTGVYPVDDMQVHPDDPDIIVCSWLVSQKATIYVGSLSFVLRFTCMSGYKIDYSWSTGVFSAIAIATGIDNAGLVVEQYDDTLQKWYMELIAAGTMGVNVVDEARANAIDSLAKETSGMKTDLERKGNEVYASLPDDYTSLSDDIVELYSNTGHIFSSGYISNRGIFVEDTTGARIVSDYICCPENITVTFSGENDHSGVSTVAFYSIDKTFISGICNAGTNGEEIETVSPSGTYYVRLSTRRTYSKVLRFDKGSLPDMVDRIHSTITDAKSQLLAALHNSANGELAEYKEKLVFALGGVHDGNYAYYVHTGYSSLYRTDSVSAVEMDDSKYKLLYVYYDEDKNYVKYEGWFDGSLYGNINRDYPYVAFEIRTKDSSDLDVSAVEVYVHTYIVNSSAANSTVYVAPDGSDDNDGSANSPFATISAAVTAGYRSICLKAGDYTEEVVINNVNGLSIYAYDGNKYDSYSPAPRKRPTFTNGSFYDISSSTQDDNGIYSFVLPDIPKAYMDVFVDKTVSPETTGSRPSYSAGLWLNHVNKYDDVKLKPVLSMNNLLASTNSFFFDGTTVYVSFIDSDVTGFTVVGDTSSILTFVNCNNLVLSGLVVSYGIDDNVSIYGCNNVHVSNCEFAYTMTGNNVTADYSDVVFDNCLSYKARNDGFNSHYYGVSVFNDCRGVYNYDDGESSHEYCEVIVNGGEYAHNGKAGHAPVNGCKFTCSNTYAHDNPFGIYMIADEGFDLSDSAIRLNGCVSLNNTTADIGVSLYEVVAMNTVYKTTRINSGSFVDLTK